MVDWISKNVSIFVKKSDSNDPNVEFRQAIVSVVVGVKCGLKLLIMDLDILLPQSLK